MLHKPLLAPGAVDQALIFTGVPECPTRLALLKTGEADLATVMIGDEGTAVPRDPKLRLAVIRAPVTEWMEFPEPWDPASPWHDRRVRLVAHLALDRQIEPTRETTRRVHGVEEPHR